MIMYETFKYVYKEMLFLHTWELGNWLRALGQLFYGAIGEDTVKYHVEG